MAREATANRGDHERGEQADCRLDELLQELSITEIATLDRRHFSVVQPTAGAFGRRQRHGGERITAGMGGASPIALEY